MPVCPKCNSVYEDDLKFCSTDGTLLVPMTSETHLPIGAVVNESLRVIDRVRTDRFGVVYRVEDTIVSSRSLSLRLFRRGLVTSKVFEALGGLADRLRSQLNEPHIVANHIPIQLEDGRHAILGDDCHGSTLDSILAREAPLTTQFTVMALVRIADILSSAHGVGLFHGNVTPENVLLVDRTERAITVKLADFGIASTIRRHNARALTSPVDLLPLRSYDNYYPPELVTGRGTQADARADVFAIGALCYQMLSGWIPFTEAALERDSAVYLTDDPRPLIVLNKELGVPTALERTMLKALERDPRSRFQTMVELVEALQEIELELTIRPTVKPASRKATRVPKKATSLAPSPTGRARPATGTAGVRARDTADLGSDVRGTPLADDPGKTFDGQVTASDVLQSEE
jgi:eukaryotic-like serine/threonine-protein kinase